VGDPPIRKEVKTIRHQYKVDRRDIMYLRATIESYDGMAVVRTVDPGEAIIELLIAPGCESRIEELVEDLRNRENLAMTYMKSAKADFIAGCG
jgi:hypothetical protein